MIKLTISSPLPPLLGFAEDIKSLHFEIPYENGINILDIFKSLALNYPKFNYLLNDDKNLLISHLLISVNGKMLSNINDRKNPLVDGCDIVLLTPYSGG